MRNLQKHVEKIARKLAIKVAERLEEEQTSGVKGAVGDAAAAEPLKEDAASERVLPNGLDPDLLVTEDKLGDLVGKPPFTSDRLYEESPPAGTVMGLAWTSLGGALLCMEAIALPKNGDIKGAPHLSVTGQLGNVMTESSRLALLVARRELASRADAFSAKVDFFDKHELHLHCPEGATPKDGPSAGITMVTALLSLALEHPIRPDLAMTGEISLNGKVLPVGGIREKTIAARRAGCGALVLPRENRRDFEELPDYLREGLEVSYASDYRDVFKVAFPTPVVE